VRGEDATDGRRRGGALGRAERERNPCACIFVECAVRSTWRECTVEVGQKNDIGLAWRRSVATALYTTTASREESVGVG
jgi:hypothetical protein